MYTCFYIILQIKTYYLQEIFVLKKTNTFHFIFFSNYQSICLLYTLSIVSSVISENKQSEK